MGGERIDCGESESASGGMPKCWSPLEVCWVGWLGADAALTALHMMIIVHRFWMGLCRMKNRTRSRYKVSSSPLIILISSRNAAANDILF